VCVCVCVFSRCQLETNSGGETIGGAFDVEGSLSRPKCTRLHSNEEKNKTLFVILGLVIDVDLETIPPMKNSRNEHCVIKPINLLPL